MENEKRTLRSLMNEYDRMVRETTQLQLLVHCVAQVKRIKVFSMLRIQRQKDF
jgi:hypothetical protein